MGRMLPIRAAAFAAIACLALIGCQSTTARYAASGPVAGTYVSTCVDSLWAQYLIENYLTGRRTQPAADEAIGCELARLPHGCLPGDDDLLDLSRRYSPDFATVVLAERFNQQPLGEPMRQYFREELPRSPHADTLADGQPIDPTQMAFLFVPGWLYRTSPETESDAPRQRRVLQENGWEAELIPTDENGDVDCNARLVAQWIRAYGKRGKAVFLVSLSKAGPEVMAALGILLGDDETAHVRGWLNIAGVVQGSIRADRATSLPFRPLVRLIFQTRGYGGLDGIEGLRTDISLCRYTAAVPLPAHIVVINMVPVPLTGHVTENLRRPHRVLSRYGPNDGLSRLRSQVVCGGSIVPMVGYDHYFKGLDAEGSTMAMARAVLRYEKLVRASTPLPAVSVALGR